MPRFTAALAAGLVLLAAIGCSNKEQTVNLKFKYEPGMRLAYEQVTKSNMRTIMGDSVIDQSTHTYHVDIVVNVLASDDDGTARLLDSSKWWWVAPAKTDPAAVDTMRKTMVTEISIEPNGRATDIRIPDADESTATWIKNYYEQVMPIFPSGEVPVGFSWSQSTRVLMPDENMDATTNYRIKSLVKERGYNCAVIEYDGNLIIPVQPRTRDTCTYSGWDKIDMRGVTYFAHTEGVIVSERQNWTMEGHRTAVCDGGDEKQYIVQTESTVDYDLADIQRR